MINKFPLTTIEDIAIQYITTLQPTESNLEETINTVEDPKLSIKGATSIGGSFYCRTNKFFDNQNYIFFRKIPQKNINEDELSFLNSETEESSSRVTIHNSSTVIKLTHTKIFVKNCKNLTYNKKNFFPLKYDIVYDGLSGLYIPLITNLEDLNNLRNYMNDTKNRIEYFSLHESVFSPTKNSGGGKPHPQSPSPTKKIEEFLEEEKCCEIIEFCLILFILHLIMGAKIKHTEFINDEDMEGIYGECCFVLDKLRENIMLKLLYNENYKNENEKNKINNDNKNYSSNISFESVCSRYIKDYFKENKKTQKNIINNLNSNLEIIFQRLYTAINILLINFTKVKIYTNNVNNPDEVESYFLELLDYNFPQTDDELIQKEEEKKIKINDKEIKIDDKVIEINEENFKNVIKTIIENLKSLIKSIDETLKIKLIDENKKEKSVKLIDKNKKENYLIKLIDENKKEIPVKLIDENKKENSLIEIYNKFSYEKNYKIENNKSNQKNNFINNLNKILDDIKKSLNNLNEQIKKQKDELLKKDKLDENENNKLLVLNKIIEEYANIFIETNLDQILMIILKNIIVKYQYEKKGVNYIIKDIYTNDEYNVKDFEDIIKNCLKILNFQIEDSIGKQWFMIGETFYILQNLVFGEEYFYDNIELYNFKEYSNNKMLEKYDVMKGLYELYSKLPKKFLIKNKKIKFFDYPHIKNEENNYFINIY